MRRVLWIPVAGTLAALVAIVLAHGPRDEAAAPPAIPPRPELPAAGPEPARAEEPAEPEPEAGAAKHLVRLLADGALEDVDTGRRFADVDELADALAPAKDSNEARPRIVVTNASPDVSEADLDAVLEKLRGRFDVRKDYSAPSAGD